MSINERPDFYLLASSSGCCTQQYNESEKRAHLFNSSFSPQTRLKVWQFDQASLFISADLLSNQLIIDVHA